MRSAARPDPAETRGDGDAGKGYRCGVFIATAKPRGVLEADLASKNATFATPATLVALVEWSEKILCA
jgi:hypothetical protein